MFVNSGSHRGGSREGGKLVPSIVVVFRLAAGSSRISSQREHEHEHIHSHYAYPHTAGRPPLQDNDVHDMEDAGMAIMESMNAHIHDNSFKNVKYGVRLSLGASENLVEDNVFEGCTDCELPGTTLLDRARQ